MIVLLTSQIKNISKKNVFSFAFRHFSMYELKISEQGWGEWEGWGNLHKGSINRLLFKKKTDTKTQKNNYRTTKRLNEKICFLIRSLA